jgi:hypothetical protein
MQPLLLMYAEAAYYTGDEGAARKSINMVRERARGKNPSVLPDISATGTKFLDAIYHKR